MKLTKFLICIAALVVCVQTITATKSYHNRPKKSIEENVSNDALDKSVRELRGIKDVWAKIRESAINSWNFVKALAENTKEKIKIFMENLNAKAEELKQQFQHKLKELECNLKKIVQDIYGTAELVKKCYNDERSNVQNILEEVYASMKECIAQEISQLSLLSKNISLPTMNNTKFMGELDDNIDLCKKNKEDVAVCLSKVQNDLYSNITGLENDILKNNYDARNIADNIKETLTTCSLNNLINATNLIAAEIIEIVKCVTEAQANEEESEISTNEIS